MSGLDIVLFDYGTGNLHSLGKALGRHGHRVRIEQDAAGVRNGDALVLPGVGAFGAAAARLAPQRGWLRDALRNGLPCLGICLGLQILFESSEEGEGRGIGALEGRVRRLSAQRLPQMGWNVVDTGPDALFAGMNGLIAYYANSYVAEPADADTIIAWSRYGQDRFAAAVRSGNTWGVQFHPEKSGRAGLQLLDNFLAQVRP